MCVKVIAADGRFTVSDTDIKFSIIWISALCIGIKGYFLHSMDGADDIHPHNFTTSSGKNLCQWIVGHPLRYYPL